MIILLSMLYSCDKSFFSLKAGKSTSWEDGGWGAWDEAELQEPVSLYVCVYICVCVTSLLWKSFPLVGVCGVLDFFPPI